MGVGTQKTLPRWRLHCVLQYLPKNIRVVNRIYSKCSRLIDGGSIHTNIKILGQWTQLEVTFYTLQNNQGGYKSVSVLMFVTIYFL